MSLRLRSQKESNKTLSFANRAWFSLLDMAEEYGWNPMGTVLPDWRYEPESHPAQDLYGPGGWNGDYYTTDGGRLVLFEDALNLADALERLFMEYEPERTYSYPEISLTGDEDSGKKLRAGIGAIIILADFCRSGAFLIERPGLRS